MKRRLHIILFVTSFLPVILFKLLSRGGGGTIGQVRTAAVLGFALGIVQFLLSRRLLHHNTYLEKAFLGFLGIGILWIFLAPSEAAGLFALYSTSLLYLTLFLTTLVPQMAGRDPFTYAIAKQWYPASVWITPDFRIINLRITYVWSAIFLVCFLSSFGGHGRMFFTIVVPLVLILALGIPFSMRYPKFHLKRRFAVTNVDRSTLPSTARELVLGMPGVFDGVKGRDIEGDIQFDLSGEGGGQLFLSIAGGQCTSHEGTSPNPLLTIRSPADVWLKIASGEIDRPRALMDGLYTVEGDMGLLSRMGELFRRPGGKPDTRHEARGDGPVETRTGPMRILAVQGSPRPKTGNTAVLLERFLKGAESQGAVTEAIHLKEKEILPCQGCYTCWTKTPGICVFDDDMTALLEKVKACDVLVYATPLYVYNVSALMKAFQERMIPLLDPHLVKEDSVYHHPGRFATHRKMVLVANCGFPEISHFDGLRQVFRHLERSSGMPLVGEILMPAGELLARQGFRPVVQPVLDAAYRAGVELVRDGVVSKETEAMVQSPVMGADEFASMANMHWDSHVEEEQGEPPPHAGRIEDMGQLLRGMAASLNPQAAGDVKATIQFRVTGRQPGNWFLTIGDGKCRVSEGETASPSLTIHTPSDVWLAIANRELNGQKAFMEGRYTVEGDMGVLVAMQRIFKK
ncbi:SCP2 sterol-binding domain-containing protein [Syntrophorhabdus aromaticivorans]|uniref:SCP2 sterol-binding domain-containing protein n=1 Tax=Syntrophorhabdus aromaticivorans TaxID=328301 RepID=UPI00041A1752|nr:SCP2 sterol-binding domain-containing protein [Syntrophorhabdus aromaticivorans]